MNVLGVFPTYRPSSYVGNIGGGEISNRILLEGLVKHGCSVSVVTLAGPGREECIVNGVSVYDVGMGEGKLARLRSVACFRRKLLSIADELNVDVIVSATEAVPAALSLGKRLGVPVGVVIRALENFDSKDNGVENKIKRVVKSFLFGNYGEKSLSNSSFLLPNSEFMGRLCKDRFPSIPTRVIYPPIKFDVNSIKFGGSISNIVMVGTGLNKGTSLTFDLADALPDLCFRIVGMPEVPAGQEIRKKNVTCVGWCDIQEEFQNNADLVIVPSVCEEAFGRVVVEALAAGKLVLASKIGGLPEALNYEDDLLLPPNDFYAWKERIKRVAMCPEKYNTICERAGRDIERFSYENQVESLYQSLAFFIKGGR